MADREYFPCYHSYFKKCEKLTDQELGRLFRALMMYSSTGERQELAGRESIAFDFIADDIDRADGAYREKCEKNSQNGKKGGRPKNQTVPEKPNGFKKSQYKGEDKDKDEDKDKGEVKEFSRTRAGDSAVSAVFNAYFEKIGKTMTDGIRDDLLVFLSTMGPDCCIRAFDAAVEANKVSWNYVKRVLESKRDQGVRSIADWEREEEKHRGTRGSAGGDASGSGGKGKDWGVNITRL